MRYLLPIFALMTIPAYAQDRGGGQDRDNPNRPDSPVYEAPQWGFRIARNPRNADWYFEDSSIDQGVLSVVNDVQPQPYRVSVYVQLPDNSSMNLGFDPDNVCQQTLDQIQEDESLQNVVERSRQRSRSIPGESNCFHMIVDAETQDGTEIEWNWFVMQSGRNGALVRIAVLSQRGQFNRGRWSDPEIDYILRSFQAFQPRQR